MNKYKKKAISKISKYIILGLLLIYIVFMMIGFLITIPSGVSAINNYDKLIHFAEFMILSVLILWVFKSFNFKQHYILGILVCLVFVIASESLQALTPTRNFSYQDMIADVFGILVGVGIFRWIVPKIEL